MQTISEALNSLNNFAVLTNPLLRAKIDAKTVIGGHSGGARIISEEFNSNSLLFFRFEQFTVTYHSRRKNDAYTNKYVMIKHHNRCPNRRAL